MVEERVGVAAELENAEPLVDHHACRAISGEQHAVRLAKHLGSDGGLPGPALPTRPGGARGAHCGQQARRAPGGLPAIEPMFLVERREQRRGGIGRLSRPYEQKAIRPECIVEGRQHHLLERKLEVDEDIATADEIDARERRIAGQIVTSEDAHLANDFADLVVVAHFDEEATQTFRGDIPRDIHQVGALSRFRQGPLAEIGGEDLQRRFARLICGQLQQGHRDRIDLFTGRAPGHPQPQRCVRREVLQQAAQDLLVQGLENLRVTEERGYRDEAFFVQRLRFRNVSFEMLRVVAKRRDLAHRHASCDPSSQSRLLVRVEVGATGLPQRFEDPAEPLVVVVLMGNLRRVRVRASGSPRSLARREIGVMAETGQFSCDVFGCQDEIDAPGGNCAAGHAVALG